MLPGGPRTAWTLDLLQREVHSPRRVRELTGIDISRAIGGSGDDSRSFESLVEAELANYLQPTLLADADGFSMCSSIELRVPFVDRSLFSAAVANNRDRRIPRGKKILSESLSDSYLAKASRRSKQGFSVPMAAWMANGPLRAATARVKDDHALLWNFIDEEALQPAIDALSRGRWSELWSLVSLNEWLGTLDAAAPTS